MLRIVLLCLITTSLSAQSDPAGLWYGVLSVGPQKLPLIIDMREQGEAWTGTLTSPAQSPNPMELTTVTVTADSVTFTIASFDITYRGELVADSITGLFSQGPFQSSLTYTREQPADYPSTESKAKPRPQDPTDFPYRRETVSFAGGADDVRIAGEITWPTDEAPRAGLVLVSGSGPQNRNEDLGPQMNHRPFLVLSDYLTRRGYAVLRYDDRGVGESTGIFSTATSADFAGDAAAAFRFLADQLPDGVPVGLAGHSEGGLILPLVAQMEGNIDFMVLLAAPGVPIPELMAEQRRLVGQGSSPLEPVQLAITDYLRQHPKMEEEALRRGLTDTIIATIPGLPESVRTTITDEAAFAKPFVDAYAGPWQRYFFTYDPEPALSALRMPVLALNGELDLQVSPANLTAIREITAAAGNEQVTTQLIPGVNHLFQPATTGHPSEYAQIETTIDPKVLALIVDWLDERYR